MTDVQAALPDEVIVGAKSNEIGFPLSGDFTCGTSTSVSGTLAPAPTSSVRVTATWNRTSGTGPAPASNYVDTTSGYYSIPFSNLNPGFYSITVSCSNSNYPNSTTDFEVRVCNLGTLQLLSAPSGEPSERSAHTGNSVDVYDTIPSDIHDALYVTVALESFNDRRLIAVRADDDVRNGRFIVTFRNVPNGQYHARRVIYRLRNSPRVLPSETITVPSK